MHLLPCNVLNHVPKSTTPEKQLTEDMEEKVENYPNHGEPPRKVGKNVPARAQQGIFRLTPSASGKDYEYVGANAEGQSICHSKPTASAFINFSPRQVGCLHHLFTPCSPGKRITHTVHACEHQSNAPSHAQSRVLRHTLVVMLMSTLYRA